LYKSVDDLLLFVLAGAGISCSNILTIRRTDLPAAPFHSSFTSLHPPFTTYWYQSACYKKGEGVKAKKGKLYWGSIFAPFVLFCTKKYKICTKAWTDIFQENEQEAPVIASTQ
jgi:hypothetical protein